LLEFECFTKCAVATFNSNFKNQMANGGFNYNTGSGFQYNAANGYGGLMGGGSSNSASVFSGFTTQTIQPSGNWTYGSEWNHTISPETYGALVGNQTYVVPVPYKIYVPAQNGGNDPKEGGGSYNALLEWGKNAGTYAGYGSGAIGMLDYRRALPISSKIGTFGRFSSAYSGLGVARVGLGRLGMAGSALTVISDYQSMNSGLISAGLFPYRTTGAGASIGTSIGVGAVYGGPWGAAAGAIVSGAWWLGEQVYDTWTNDIMPAMRNAIPTGGWYPPR
jgi:hypothetical protein